MACRHRILAVKITGMIQCVLYLQDYVALRKLNSVFLSSAQNISSLIVERILRKVFTSLSHSLQQKQGHYFCLIC